jgi:hypothetical protein
VSAKWRDRLHIFLSYLIVFTLFYLAFSRS